VFSQWIFHLALSLSLSLWRLELSADERHLENNTSRLVLTAVELPRREQDAQRQKELVVQTVDHLEPFACRSQWAYFFERVELTLPI